MTSQQPPHHEEGVEGDGHPVGLQHLAIVGPGVHDRKVEEEADDLDAEEVEGHQPAEQLQRPARGARGTGS